ncbi:MAG: hypothetical protein UW34_C0001G0014 [Parcubacteria group bacterium GW2011_GWA2_44_15]|nr:MAG: hypothetical protein UW34_C0001G0014 [Parcubacteria group bacterium GW2011_GWA2_44_15]
MNRNQIFVLTLGVAIALLGVAAGVSGCRAKKENKALREIVVLEKANRTNAVVVSDVPYPPVDVESETNPVPTVSTNAPATTHAQPAMVDTNMMLAMIRSLMTNQPAPVVTNTVTVTVTNKVTEVATNLVTVTVTNRVTEVVTNIVTMTVTNTVEAPQPVATVPKGPRSEIYDRLGMKEPSASAPDRQTNLQPPSLVVVNLTNVNINNNVNSNSVNVNVYNTPGRRQPTSRRTTAGTNQTTRVESNPPPPVSSAPKPIENAPGGVTDPGWYKAPPQDPPTVAGVQSPPYQQVQVVYGYPPPVRYPRGFAVSYGFGYGGGYRYPSHYRQSPMVYRAGGYCR